MKQFNRIVMVLILIFACIPIHAQMKVESFTIDEQDQTARTDAPVREGDGKKSKLCALIKVVTTEMDCTFDNGSLGIKKVEQHPNESEIWVYVPSGTNRLKIAHPKHGQLDTDLKNGYYRFPECKPATVYYLKLHTEFRPDEDIIKKENENKYATVSFNIFPKDAKVKLRKVLEITNSNGILEKTMPLGTYHYRVSADNYHYYDGQFELDTEGSTKNVDIILRQAFGWAVLPTEFDVSDCLFSIGGKSHSVSGFKIALPSGKHKLHIEKRNYYPEDIDVSIEDSACVNIMPQMRPILGRLVVNTPEQPGATVKVDGKEIGVTPFEVAKDLIIGKHTIEILRPNYVSQTHEIEIKENTTEKVNVVMTSLGNFNITTTPVGASLYINNKYIGVTPCAMNELASGYYNIRFEKEKYHTYNKRMHLDAAHPNNSFKLKYQYLQKLQIYFNPVFDYTSNYKAVGINIGAYIENINIEGFFDYGLDKQDLCWVEYDKVDSKESYSNMAFGGRLGYGIILGTQFRVTPQAGGRIVLIHGGADKYAFSGNSICLSLGCKLDFAFTKHFSLNLTPEYRLPISKSENFTILSENSPAIEGMSEGFGCRMGISLFF